MSDDPPIVLVVPDLDVKFFVQALSDGTRIVLAKEGVRFTQDLANLINEVKTDRARRRQPASQADTIPAARRPAAITMKMLRDLLASGHRVTITPNGTRFEPLPRDCLGPASPDTEPDSPAPT